MSAWMITDAHADLLATAYLAFVDPKASGQIIGQELLAENARSLEARYADTDNFKQAALYQHRPWDGPLDPRLVRKQLDCADYQCCEHDGWRSSNTAFRLGLLEQRLKALPSEWDVDDRARPWGVDESHRPEPNEPQG